MIAEEQSVIEQGAIAHKNLDPAVEKKRKHNREYMRKWREENKERAREQGRKDDQKKIKTDKYKNRKKQEYIKYKDIILARNKRWRDKNREKLLASYREKYRNNRDKIRKRTIEYRYGLTEKDFCRMLEQQGFSCAICGSENWGGKNNTPQVDHNHDTGVVRGLLCQACNVAIGMIKEKPSVAFLIQQYLLSNCGRE